MCNWEQILGVTNSIKQRNILHLLQMKKAPEEGLNNNFN